MKVRELSALRSGRFYSAGNIHGTTLCQRLSQHQGHSVAGRIMSMKNYNDTIGNRTRELLACSATAPTRAPSQNTKSLILSFFMIKFSSLY